MLGHIIENERLKIPSQRFLIWTVSQSLHRLKQTDVCPYETATVSLIRR